MDLSPTLLQSMSFNEIKPDEETSAILQLPEMKGVRLVRSVADPGFETRVFPLAMEKTSMSKPLDAGAQADGEHVLQRPVDEHGLLPPVHY
jgi:hypothetical protein